VDEEILNDYLSSYKIVQNFLIEINLFSESSVNTIHYFLGQLLAFGCIYFSKFNHQNKQKERKKAIFFQFFKKKSNSDEYKFNQTVIHKIMKNQRSFPSGNLKKSN